MNLISLFSGGKDSTYSIFKAKQEGHNIVSLVSLYPKSEDSHMLHHPNMKWTKLQAKAMGIPYFSAIMESNDEQSELATLTELLKNIKIKYKVEGIIHGGILSKYQKNRFEKAGNEVQLEVISPLWNINAKKYFLELLSFGFRFIVTSVTTAGLDEHWLGKEITFEDLSILESLSLKFGFNLAFEGGEAETFVINCPLFKNSIEILSANKFWDGYRGRFEITDAILNK